MTIVITFCAFLLFFVGVGIWSSREKSETTEDYLVASRSVSPWLVALSAVSTNNSGYMFIGLIGFTYQVGLSAVWLTMGWVLGDYLTWLWFHGRLRRYSEEMEVNSVPTLMGTGLGGETSRPITAIAGVATLIFLALYAAAQLKAGSAATETMFGWPSWVGLPWFTRKTGTWWQSFRPSFLRKETLAQKPTPTPGRLRSRVRPRTGRS